MHNPNFRITHQLNLLMEGLQICRKIKIHLGRTKILKGRELIHRGLKLLRHRRWIYLIFRLGILIRFIKICSNLVRSRGTPLRFRSQAINITVISWTLRIMPQFRTHFHTLKNHLLLPNIMTNKRLLNNSNRISNLISSRICMFLIRILECPRKLWVGQWTEKR